MKKYLYICLMAMAAGLASCTYPTYKTYEIIEEEDCQFNKKTVDLVVPADKWDFDSGTRQYFAHIPVPELTDRVYNYGEVSINREYNSGTANAYQVALPETSYIETSVGDEAYFYQQHIDFVYGIGFVEIFCTISDFYYEDFTPDAMRFRLQMTW